MSNMQEAKAQSPSIQTPHTQDTTGQLNEPAQHPVQPISQVASSSAPAPAHSHPAPTQDTSRRASDERSERAIQPILHGGSSSAPTRISSAPVQDTTRTSNEHSEHSIQPILQGSSSSYEPTQGPQVVSRDYGPNPAPSIPSQPSSRPVSQVPTTSSAVPIATHPAPPARAVSYDHRVHIDDGHTAAGHGPVRRASAYDGSLRKTTLPPLPGQGDMPLHASPTEYRPALADLGRMNTFTSRRTGYLDEMIVPTSRDDLHRPKTLGERMDPTIDEAKAQRAKFAATAKLNGYLLNIALGFQVLLGALTTGLAAITTGRQTSIVVSVLGGMTTLVASYLARVRGSGEPEYSTGKVKDLDHFIRECESFRLDFGHEVGHENDAKLVEFRKRLEDVLNDTEKHGTSTRDTKQPPA